MISATEARKQFGESEKVKKLSEKQQVEKAIQEAIQNHHLCNVWFKVSEETQNWLESKGFHVSHGVDEFGPYTQIRW